MSQSEKKTSTSDPTFDLVSVMYHALKGEELYSKYAQDAARGGHSDLEQFFKEVQEEERRRAERAKPLLQKYIGQSGSQQRRAA